MHYGTELILRKFRWTTGEFLCRAFSFLRAFPFHLWSNIVVSIAVDMLFCVV
jgi:hypothetical protein